MRLIIFTVALHSLLFGISLEFINFSSVGSNHNGSPEIMGRIKVENIDSWVINFLKQEGIKARIVYDNDLEDLWKQAYTLASEFSLAFYQDEWREVIQPNQVKTLKEYLKAPRVGRGTRLNRAKKAAIWSVFAEFNSLLQEQGWKDRQTAIRDACSLLKKNFTV